jgi:hypothetical protein
VSAGLPITAARAAELHEPCGLAAGLDALGEHAELQR